MPTSSWTKKDERQYEHIKASSRQRGASVERAEEIAARTVNKTRRKQGRTPNKTTQGTGNPNLALEDRSRDELYNRAQDLDIAGRSRMNKSALVHAIRERN